MKNKFFFIKSSNSKDKDIITIFTKSAKQALAMAQMYYLNNSFKGHPEIMTL